MVVNILINYGITLKKVPPIFVSESASIVIKQKKIFFIQKMNIYIYIFFFCF